MITKSVQPNNKPMTRKVTCFNTSYHIMTYEIIGKAFKNVPSKHIPRSHSLKKAFNEYTDKLYYTTTVSMASKMASNANRVEKQKGRLYK